MEWASVVSGLVGGVIGIVGTLGATVLGNRQSRLTRWDQERALAVAELVEAAARSEGSQFRRGRSADRGEGPDLWRRRVERCEDDFDTLMAKRARVGALVPELAPEVAAMLDTERAVRRRAAQGLRGREDEGWFEVRDAHRDAVDRLAAKAAGLLGTVGTGR